MKRKGIIMWMLLLILCLCSCGRQESAAGQGGAVIQGNDPVEAETVIQESSSDESAQSPAPEEEEEPIEEAFSGEDFQPFDWRNVKWQIERNAGDEHKLYAVEYLKGLESTTDREYRSRYTIYKIWGHRIYALDRYRIPRDDKEGYFYYINYYDAVTGEFWHHAIELPELEEYEGYEYYIMDFDVRNEQEVVFFVEVQPLEESFSVVAYEAVHCTFEGELLSRLDLYPFICEKAGEQRWIQNDVFVDCDGYYYLNLARWWQEGEEFYGDYEDMVYILNPAGELEGVMLCENAEQPHFCMKTPDGYPLFIWQRTVTLRYLVFYDKELQESRRLTQVGGHLWDLDLNGSMLTEDGYLYYYDQDKGLNRCNLTTGERDCCLKYGQLGMGDNSYYTYTLQGADGEPVIIDTSEGEALICRLGTEKPESHPIRLVSFSDSDQRVSFLKDSAVQFSKSDLKSPIEVEKPVGETEDYRTRMLAELTAGKGADIYYVSAEDMEMLYEKGVLAELTDVLSEELLESIYPGVLGGGVIDGHQIGLAPSAWSWTMLAKEDYWAEDSWTLEELMDVIDAHPEITHPIIHSGSYMDGYLLLQMLLFQNLEDTPFLDVENGSCNFEDPLFIRLLELAKHYQEHPIELTTSSDVIGELLEEGNYIAVVVNLSDFPDFSKQMSALHNSCHLVGFPAEHGSGSYWRTDYYLVVNRQTQQMERAYAFLAELLSKEKQSSNLQFVRRDILEDRIIRATWVSEDENPLQYRIDSYTYIGLETKPDGSSWQEEYEEVLDQCEMASGSNSYIQEIIVEEAGDYFDGIKTAETTAGLIQNRVQLYLKEQVTAEAVQQGKGSQLGGRNK